MRAVSLPERLAPLRERNYRILFTGQALSLLGDEMTPVAVTFAILDRGGNARQVGWVLGAGTLSMVVLLLFGGVMADRLARRSVMLTSDVVRGVAQACLAAILIRGHWQLWELMVLEAAWGAGAAFFNPALTGLVPQLLPGDLLVKGNALYNLVWSFGSVLGPAVAGVLVATVGPGSAVAVDAGTFAASAVCLTRLDLPVAAACQHTANLLREMREGWDAFRSRTWLWVIVSEFGLWHLLVFAPVLVLGAVVAKTHLGGAEAWGTILGLFGGGSIVGGIVALHYRPSRPLLVATVATAGFVPFPAMLAMSAPVPVIGAAAALGGAGFALFGTYWDTTIQEQVPAQLLSRVSAYDWFGSTALFPIGFAIAGPLASVLGVSTMLWAATFFMGAEIAVVLSFSSVRNMRSGRTAGAADGLVEPGGTRRAELDLADLVEPPAFL